MDEVRKEVLSRIEYLEKEKKFDEHVDPIDYSLSLIVDENFPYIKKGWCFIKNSFLNNFIVKPYSVYVNKNMLQTSIRGREHLKEINSAIITCNHVNKFDCLAVKKAMKGHKVYITGADFNNQKGLLGILMRAGGLLPFSSNPKAMRNLDNAITYYLEKNNYILFYPEQAMWWLYEKPRPMKKGAFHYAIKNNVPVIPVFITFEPGIPKSKHTQVNKKFTVNIMEPIFPQKQLNKKENVDYMRKKNEEMCINKYQEIYEKKLEFT